MQVHRAQIPSIFLYKLGYPAREGRARAIVNHI